MTLLAGGAGVVGFVSLRRPAPLGEVEANSLGVTWISYDEAVTEPIIDIGLPGRGRFQYPKRTRGPRTSRRITAGFIQLPSNSSGSLFLPNGDRIHDFGDLVPVPWASAPDRQGYSLRLHRVAGVLQEDTTLKIRAPYDPKIGAAPYDAVTGTIGPFEFDGNIDRLSYPNVAILIGKLTKGNPAQGRIMSEYGTATSLTYIRDERVHLYGLRGDNGDIVFKGAVAADGLKRTPFRFVVKPTFRER